MNSVPTDPSRDLVLLEAFGSLENAQSTAALVQRFTQSYDQNQGKVPLETWLAQEFKSFPDVWANEAEMYH